MRRKITAGLILRKDGRYQRNELIGDKRRTFTAKDPAKVWADIQKAQEEYEEQERQRIITRDSGPLFSVVSDEYQAIVEKMKEGTRRSYMPNIRRAREALGEYRRVPALPCFRGLFRFDRQQPENRHQQHLPVLDR